MEDILILLVLVIVQTTKVYSLPYVANSEGKCHNTTTEYVPDGSNLCCSKCPPGSRLITECSKNTDSVCENCGLDMYMENWNYAKNCFSCSKCKQKKGLQFGQNCTTTKNSKCVCQPGMYCQMGFDDPYCTDCTSYTVCKAGFGVSAPGTRSSNVKCEKCPNGAFSSINSHKDRCKPHTNCNGRAVITEGDAFKDTICEEQTEPAFTTPTVGPMLIITSTASTTVTTVGASTDSTTPNEVKDSTPSFRSVSGEVATLSTTRSTTTSQQDTVLVAVIAGVIGLLFLFIIVFLVFLYKRVLKKDSLIIHTKVDANGNCESGDTIDKNYSKDSQMTSSTATTPEQVCLLEKVEVNSDQSQCSSQSETLTRGDGYSSDMSSSSLQSTSGLDRQTSVLSEPRTLLSNVEPVSVPSSIPAQSSSQPTSPQIISPVTNSPHVNVNITLHIGNGSCGTPSFTPTDFRQPEYPFGAEEESFSTPQQEAGKQSQMSVQESVSDSTLRL
ncbi:tumor necrosis factor receptor superfamily member 1B [Leuresthes tenuis]|uniref:tumor necrosis factor receptor superfamily member 1B n=1 Tax=Leuresthes tenuis TaxID=355514 RepID=UPI003B50F3AD